MTWVVTILMSLGIWAESWSMARPFPYSLLSWTMAIVFGFTLVVRYLMMPAAWALSSGSTRWNTFPPGTTLGMSTFVAEALTITRPFSSSEGSTALVSPEKAGP